MAKPRITRERFDQLLVDYTVAVQEMACAGLSPAPDATTRAAEWQRKASEIAREIREGVFPS